MPPEAAAETIAMVTLLSLPALRPGGIGGIDGGGRGGSGDAPSEPSVGWLITLTTLIKEHGVPHALVSIFVATDGETPGARKPERTFCTFRASLGVGAVTKASMRTLPAVMRSVTASEETPTLDARSASMSVITAGV